MSLSRYVLHSFTVLPALTLLAVNACGQANSTPFRTISMQLSGSANTNTTTLNTYWHQPRGAGLNLVTPFYWGYAEVGGSVHRYEIATRDVPRFDAVLLYLGWGPRLHIGSRLAWYNGFRIGNYLMSFDEATFSSVRNENELSIAFHSRAELRLFGNLAVLVSGTYQRTFTYVRLNLVFVSAGLTYTFSSPGWLQTFLQ